MCLGAWTVSRSLPRPTSLSSQPIIQSAGTIAAIQPSVANNNNNDESKTIQIYKKVGPGVVNITSTTLSFDFFFISAVVCNLHTQKQYSQIKKRN